MLLSDYLSMDETQRLQNLEILMRRSMSIFAK